LVIPIGGVSMPTTVKVTISLPQELAEYADKLASQRGRPRSQIIAELIDESRGAAFREELAEAYRSMAEESAKFAREAFPLSAQVWPTYETKKARPTRSAG
jgi:predicted DNA-binding protein